MTIPEWAVVLSLSTVATVCIGIFGWGVKKIVDTFASMGTAIGGINTHLATQNGRLAKTEQWQQLHQKTDDERHDAIEKNADAIWKAIDGLRA